MHTEGWCSFDWFFSLFPGSIIVENVYINNFSSKNLRVLSDFKYTITKSCCTLLPLLPNLQLFLHSFSYILIPDTRLSPSTTVPHSHETASPVYLHFHWQSSLLSLTFCLCHLPTPPGLFEAFTLYCYSAQEPHPHQHFHLQGSPLSTTLKNTNFYLTSGKCIKFSL